MVINTPVNFSSMWEDLTFECVSVSKVDMPFEIIDDVSDEVLGVKYFYLTNSAKINVAPLLFEKMLPEPTRLESSGMKLPEVGFPRIRVEVDACSSSGVYFTYAKGRVEAPEILTTMPHTRLLYGDECDQVAVVAASGTTLSYVLSGEPVVTGEAELYKSVTSSVSGGARVFYLNADDYASDYKSLTFSAYQDGEAIGEVCYSLLPEPSKGYRVAWISSRGSIEHYTFPVVASESYLSSGATAKTLRSAYGTAHEEEALSEIISSPKVWRVTRSDYLPIEVVTTEQVVRREGALMIANIKIVENG